MVNDDSESKASRARERDFADAEARRILDFWREYGPDSRGEFDCRLSADGSTYDGHVRGLVAAGRFVANFATAAIAFDSEQYRQTAQLSLDDLGRYRDPQFGGFFWTLKDGQPHDTRKLAYGHAFVLLAASTAVKAGLSGGQELLLEITQLVDDRFFGDSPMTWDFAAGDWTGLSPIHSNNPNMHFCEAFISAFEATGDRTYLVRALRIAETVGRQALAGTRGIYENYDGSWIAQDRPHFDVEPDSMQSQWTALPGHLAEWAKLLGVLHGHTGSAWLLEAAEAQYRLAWGFGWDRADRGVYLAVDGHGRVVEPSKSYWPPPEFLGAAAVLERLTLESNYASDRAIMWSYIEETMIDPNIGGWYKTPSRPHERTDFRKGDDFDPDYHALGGCYEVMGVLR